MPQKTTPQAGRIYLANELKSLIEIAKSLRIPVVVFILEMAVAELAPD